MNKKKESKVVPNVRFKGFTDDWKQRKLGELAFFNPKEKLPDVFEYVDLESVVGIEMLSHRTEEKATAPSRAQRLAHTGDLFYQTVRPYQKNNYLFEKPEKHYVFSTGYAQLRPLVDGYFLLSLVQNGQFVKTVLDNCTGTNYPAINANDLAEIDVFYPKDEHEHHQIGEYFRHLDNIIILHQQKITLLTKLKKAMLEKMFPKKGTVIPEFRFNGFANAWEQRKLEEIITEYKETVDSDCTLPILTSSKTEGVILQEEHFGRKQQHDITGYNILPRNYCTYRNRSDGVDFTFNINKCCDKGIISKFYPVFSGKNSDVFFLSLVLNNSDEVVREIAYTCTGTGQKVLSFLNLQKMKVRVPSFDEQKEIATYFDSLDNLIILHQRKIDKIKNMKKAMLNQMFI
ncbi:restriction endonuclease subunit S [Ligilactobacillus ruminis]|uniref:restriction endonuclease subunit S n=1 Tax=Ligilactobacillus ruminis TaxID=1623 RepID=UPI0015628705|nr:restriction endonuclease subunit S [Ligilactobacillus ruminis]